jgi:hypothetical protein
VTDEIRTPRTGRRRTLRRAAAVVALSAAVAAGLSACDVQPGAAALVAGDRLTEAQVEQVVDSVHDKIPAGQFGSVREEVVGALVMRDLAKRVAADRHVTVPPPDYTAMAQGGLSANNPYVRLEAETQTYIGALGNSVRPTAPSEADLQEIYQSLVTQGAVNPAQSPYDQVRSQLDTPQTERAVALRAILAAAAGKYHVDVNPRYGKLGYPLPAVQAGQGIYGSVAVPLGKGSPDVVTSPSAAHDTTAARS